MKVCLDDKHFNKAANLYILGMSYGYFDSKRVSDKTSHQVVMILMRNAFRGQNKEIRKSIKHNITKTLKDNSEICQEIRKIGPPSYNPKYMLSHGMSNFVGSATKSGFVDGFDENKVWQETITKIVKCK